MKVAVTIKQTFPTFLIQYHIARKCCHLILLWSYPIAGMIISHCNLLHCRLNLDQLWHCLYLLLCNDLETLMSNFLFYPWPTFLPTLVGLSHLTLTYHIIWLWLSKFCVMCFEKVWHHCSPVLKYYWNLSFKQQLLTLYSRSNLFSFHTRCLMQDSPNVYLLWHR